MTGPSPQPSPQLSPQLSPKLRRELERELITGLAPRRRRALLERLRGNAEARRAWDRAAAAMRVLEDRPVARAEIDQVERWLFEDLDEAGLLADAPARPRRRWGWLGAGLATLASAAALLWWIEPPASAPEVDLAPGLDGEAPTARLTARGAARFARPLAIELVCGTPPRPAEDRGCATDELLGFSARLAGDELALPVAATAPALSLFGLGEGGEVYYYVPTPVEPDGWPLPVDAGWQPLPLSVELGVNHAPGRVRVFALASERTPTVAELDQLAAALAPDLAPDLAQHPAATVDDPPWHLRLDAAASAAITRLCPELDRCASAQTELTIVPASTRTP